MHASGFLYDSPETWRQCAGEIRTLANGLSEPGAKAVMMWIAEGYDRIAEQAEQKTGRSVARRLFSFEQWTHVNFERRLFTGGGFV